MMSATSEITAYQKMRARVRKEIMLAWWIIQNDLLDMLVKEPKWSGIRFTVKTVSRRNHSQNQHLLELLSSLMQALQGTSLSQCWRNGDGSKRLRGIIRTILLLPKPA